MSCGAVFPGGFQGMSGCLTECHYLKKSQAWLMVGLDDLNGFSNLNDSMILYSVASGNTLQKVSSHSLPYLRRH